jgi:hypothetical protein
VNRVYFARAVASIQSGFAIDSPLEGGGFELPVPRGANTA